MELKQGMRFMECTKSVELLPSMDITQLMNLSYFREIPGPRNKPPNRGFIFVRTRARLRGGKPTRRSVVDLGGAGTES